MYTSSMQAIVNVSPTFAAITAPTNEVADEARLEYHDGQARLSELCASHGIAVHHVQANRSRLTTSSPLHAAVITALAIFNRCAGLATGPKVTD